MNNATSRMFDIHGSSTAMIDNATALRTLLLGIKGPERPVDELLKRMRQFDGAQWFGYCMTMLFAAPTAAQLAGAAPSIEQLTAMKERHKTIIAEAATFSVSRESLAGYFACVAAALALHKSSISSRPAEEWLPLFIELADAAPPAWRRLFEDAAVVLQEDAADT